MDKKIAIPINENEMLEGHFGQTKAFAIYSVENDKISGKTILTPPPHAPGVLPKWINENGVNILLVSTMGERARKILDYFNIEVFLGAPTLHADILVENFLTNKLVFDPHLCDHHNHEHHHSHNHSHNHH